MISARASTHSPSTLPLMLHGAIFTRGLFRTRFTFPDTPMVYAYIFAPLESRLADGSAANHTGVLTPSPVFLNVSRFKYFCPANPTKLIASLLLTSQFTTVIRCAPFYMRYDEKGRSRVKPERPVHHFGENILLCPDVRYIFRESIFLFFPKCPGSLEMIVVDKRVHRVVHVPVIGAFQIRDAYQIERDRLRLRGIPSFHCRLLAVHTKSRPLNLSTVHA